MIEIKALNRSVQVLSTECVLFKFSCVEDRLHFIRELLLRSKQIFGSTRKG